MNVHIKLFHIKLFEFDNSIIDNSIQFYRFDIERNTHFPTISREFSGNDRRTLGESLDFYISSQ